MILCGLLGGQRGAKSRSLTGFAGSALRPARWPHCICRKYAVRSEGGAGWWQIRSIMGNVEVVYLPTFFPCPATVPVQKFSLKISSDQCPWLVPWILANSVNSLDFVTPRAWCPLLESPDNTWAFRDNKSFIVQEKWRVFSQDRSFDNFENDTIS